MKAHHLQVQLHPSDRVRLARRLRGLSVSDWLRGLINDDLEVSGEPLLTELVRVVPAEKHGTSTGYSHYGCRCQPCRDAVNRIRREQYAKYGRSDRRRSAA